MREYTEADRARLDIAYSELMNTLATFPHDDECAYRCLNPDCNVGHGCGVCDDSGTSCDNCGHDEMTHIVDPMTKIAWCAICHDELVLTTDESPDFNVEGQPEFNGAFR